MNVDNKQQNFVIPKTLLANDVPFVALTSAVQFEIIGVQQDVKMDKKIRFNIFEIELVNQKRDSTEEAIYKISVDLSYKKTSEQLSSALNFLANGEIELIVHQSVNGVDVPVETFLWVSKFESIKESEIQNYEDEIYRGSNLSYELFEQIVSPQMLTITVRNYFFR